jgi:hypothetical protein
MYPSIPTHSVVPYDPIYPYLLSSGATDEGMSVAGNFLIGAGFGMAVSESALVMGCWFKVGMP